MSCPEIDRGFERASLRKEFVPQKPQSLTTRPSQPKSRPRSGLDQWNAVTHTSGAPLGCFLYISRSLFYPRSPGPLAQASPIVQPNITSGIRTSATFRTIRTEAELIRSHKPPYLSALGASDSLSPQHLRTMKDPVARTSSPYSDPAVKGPGFSTPHPLQSSRTPQEYVSPLEHLASIMDPMTKRLTPPSRLVIVNTVNKTGLHPGGVQ